MIRKRTPWVIKLGGSELQSGPSLSGLAKHLAEVLDPGRPTVIVHGGGDEITRRAVELGIPSRDVRGRRVTDSEMLEVVIEVLAHRVNSRLATALSHAGIPARRVPSWPDTILTVVPAGDPPGSLGWVGSPVSVDTTVLRGHLRQGLVPVVAPLGRDLDGHVYNVNADEAAGAIAAALGARLSLVTDVPGVLDGSGRVLPELSPADVQSLISLKVGVGGMIPKLEAAVSSLELGAKRAWIGRWDGLSFEPPPERGTVVVGTDRRHRLGAESRRWEVATPS
jgi:acetylglutamate kinase